MGGQGLHSTSFLFGVQQWQRVGPAVCRHYRTDEEVEGVGKTSSLLRLAGNPAVPPDVGQLGVVVPFTISGEVPVLAQLGKLDRLSRKLIMK